MLEKLTGAPLAVLLELKVPVAGLTLQLSAVMSEVVAVSAMLCPTVTPVHRGERLTVGGAGLELLEVELLDVALLEVELLEAELLEAELLEAELLEAELLAAVLLEVEVLPIRHAASTMASTALARMRRTRGTVCAGKPETGRGSAM